MTESSGTVPCATCGKSVDTLRAARVRFTESQQWYFCSAAHADEFGAGPKPASNTKTPSQQASLPSPATPAAARVTGPVEDEFAKATPSAQSPEPTGEKNQHLGGLLAEPLPHTLQASDSLAQQKTRTASPSNPDRFWWLGWAPITLTFIAAGASAALEAPFIEPLATGCLLALSHAWGTRNVQVWQREREQSGERYRARLSVEGDRVTSTGTISVSATDLRPGEEVIIGAGQIAPADGQVAHGTAQVEMWEGANQTSRVEDGDRIVAGARIVSGEVRVICTKTNEDRAFAPAARPRTQSVGSRVHASRLAQTVARVAAPIAGACTGWLLYLQTSDGPQALAGAGVVWASLSHPISLALPATAAERWLLWAGRKGVSFSHEQLVDQSGAVTVGALCARGTVLHGEPEVAEVHTLRDADEEQLLALAGGAESVVHHPVAAAVLRAARTRHIEVDRCRSHNSTPGKGVVCVSSSGDVLVLGSREMLLRERISIAMAEDTLRALESRGLTALLLARNNHLIGILALQDSLRAGAKAAVQVLLDEKIEPVLISGDSRATTEAVAHALAIEHVRPEIATAGRAREIQNLIEGGASVAVIGTTPRDDAALGAAPVPVVLGGASISWRDASHGKERAIGLADRSVLSGALSLLAARRIRSTGRRALAISLLPPALAAAATASHLAPLFAPALLAAAGALLAARVTLKNPTSAEGYD